jgi:hypothetical protein
MLSEPPPLEEQFENIICYAIKVARDNVDLAELPISSPNYERGTGPAKIAYWEDAGLVVTPLSRPHRDWQGNEVRNARECPHCNALCFSSASIGQTVNCLCCGGTFRWSS